METEKDLLILERTGENEKLYLNAVTPPVFMNSLHVFDTFEEYHDVNVFEKDQFYYGRASNPTTSIAERKIAQLEHGARAVMFSSGMAAASAAILATCKTGSHIICMIDVYQPVKRFLNEYCIPCLNMQVSYVKGTDIQEIEASIQENTSLIILESPATFIFTVVDLEKVAQIAKKYKVKTYMDNTYCTPLFQKPLDFGIDIVMHTLTKYLGGHSDILGGVLVSKDEELMRKIMNQFREWLGGVIGPMEAWLAIRGMRTLKVRLEQHQKTAQAVAEFLESHPKVKKVYYPGLKSHPQYDLIQKQQKGSSGLLSLELCGSPETALEFVDALQLFRKGCSWGGFESLAMVPLYYASQEELDFLKIGRGLIRMHCGLEGTENLIADIQRALDLVKI
ncbi:MAG TPA: aminotransferase class I/II-fold pyridoxal phosphate-dependent enzyme [Candidatus Ruminococcus avistercoris]|nr:aminotransferase class I/II-fold pyridoxal phosphate-dependent enzyme [Candidatus Ruminococcus avistercoris]